jgi:hypothetical protein
VDDAPNEHDFFAAETRVVADLRSDVERPRRVVHKTLAGIVVACLLVGGWFVFNPTAETANAPDDTAESTHVVEQTSEGVVARLTLDADSPFQLPNEHKRTADGELELVSSTSSAGPSWLPLWLDDTPAVVVISDPSTPVCVVASVVDVDRSPLRIGATGTICAEQAIRASAQCDGGPRNNRHRRVGMARSSGQQPVVVSDRATLRVRFVQPGASLSKRRCRDLRDQRGGTEHGLSEELTPDWR